MPSSHFLDTDILLYAFAETDRRQDVARSILLSDGGSFSVQVADEFVDVARRKLGWTWDRVSEALDSVRDCLGAPSALTDDIHRHALDISSRFHFRFYDSLILASATSAGCSVLYTEDMRHGQNVDGLVVTNPFKSG